MAQLQTATPLLVGREALVEFAALSYFDNAGDGCRCDPAAVTTVTGHRWLEENFLHSTLLPAPTSAAAMVIGVTPFIRPLLLRDFCLVVHHCRCVREGSQREPVGSFCSFKK